MIRSFTRLQSINPGFNPDGLLVARVSLPVVNRTDAQTDAQTERFFRQVIERVEGLPGVHAAGLIADFMMRKNPDVIITIEGRPADGAGQGGGELMWEYISHDLFQALGIPLLQGRFFRREETRDSQVAIINETMARRFYPGEDPIGRRFKFGGLQSENKWIEIVGVVGDMRRQRLEKQDVSEIYLPAIASDMELLVRVDSAPLALAGPVRREIKHIDQAAAVYGLRSGTQILENLGAGRRFQTGLLALFAVIALVLAMMGIYGVMHYAASHRTHEIGIRLALGARGADVTWLIIGQGMKLILLGLGVGLAAAYGLSRVMSQLLFGVSATDPMTFAGVALLLTFVALLACYLPARRATKVDPLVALRCE
jgi:predicted permease